MLYKSIIEKLLMTGEIKPSDRILVVCGGPADEEVLRSAGITSATVTNLNDLPHIYDGFAWETQDAEALTYDDASFDLVIEHMGLHHCHSPHKALSEMYRVAKRIVVFIENRDSLAIRIAKAIGITFDYEIEVVSAGKAGVADKPIPNFIYRWREREVTNVVRSLDPARVPNIEFFYGLRIPYERFKRTGKPIQSVIFGMLRPLMSLALKLAKKQGNEFGVLVRKSDAKLQPWMKLQNGEVAFDFEYAKKHKRYYA